MVTIFLFCCIIGAVVGAALICKKALSNTNPYYFETGKITIFYGADQSITLTQEDIVLKFLSLCETGYFLVPPRKFRLPGKCHIWIDFHNGTVIGMFENEDYGYLGNQKRDTGAPLYLPTGMNEFVHELIDGFGSI